jgi:hypothetical protein
MPDIEQTAQAEVQEMAAELEIMRGRLRRVHGNLPVSPREEVMLLGEAEPDVATELRSVIECVLSDRVEPAIQALTEAAAYRPTGEG